LILPFYHRGKLAFHLGLIPSEFGTWDIATNIPKQILEANDDSIKKLSAEQSEFIRSKSEYLVKIAEIILADKHSHYFYYYNFISNEQSMLLETLDEIITYGGGFVLLNGKAYSADIEPARYYILCQKFFAFKIYESKLFNELMKSCSRLEFEKSISSEEVKSNYIEYYAANNQFVVAEDDEEFKVYFLIEKEIPRLITITYG
jgi:hypothetical protein